MKDGFWKKRAQVRHKRVPSSRLGDFTMAPHSILITLMAAMIGVASAFLALILLRLIGLITNLAYYQRWDLSLVSPAGSPLGWWMILVPVSGSLIVGVLARYGSERIRGHGIPEALEAILIHGSRVEPRVALIKPLASAIAIGTGGPFGAEGPIIMTGGAFGSLIAQCFHLTAVERKTLLVAGAAGGMAAIFNTPLAATLLAVELMLFEWKPRSLIPVAMASVTATLVRIALPGLGPNALFLIPSYTPTWNPGTLLACAAVGLLAGLLAIVLTLAVYLSEDFFQKLPLHWMWWPVIGGLVIGLGGIIYPPALGVGYNLIQQLLLGNTTWSLILGLLLVKTLIWSIALSSGTSGGVLAPLLLIGGALGALESFFLPAVFPGFWPLISMTAVLAAAIGCPLTCIVFSVELTHEITALLPLLVTTMIAHGLVVLVLRRSILTEKISRHGYHLSREFALDALDIIRIRDVMHTNMVTLQEHIDHHTLLALLQRRSSEQPATVPAQRLYPVLDHAQHLIGVVTDQELLRLLPAQTESLHKDQQSACASSEPVYDLRALLHTKPVVIHPEDPLQTVVDQISRSGYTRFPVVDRTHPEQLQGLLSLHDILRVRARHLAEEHQRERTLNLRLLFAARGAAVKKLTEQ